MPDRPVHMSALYRKVACDGKVAFDSISLAQRVAKRRRRAPAIGGRQVVYRCHDCGKYHIGGTGKKAGR
jgi:hypothetical protein